MASVGDRVKRSIARRPDDNPMSDGVAIGGVPADVSRAVSMGFCKLPVLDAGVVGSAVPAQLSVERCG